MRRDCTWEVRAGALSSPAVTSSYAKCIWCRTVWNAIAAAASHQIEGSAWVTPMARPANSVNSFTRSAVRSSRAPSLLNRTV